MMASLHVWTWIAWVVLILAPFAIGPLCWWFGLTEGEHRGRCAERERQLERERRAALRALPPPPEIRAKTGRLPTGMSNYTPGNFAPSRTHVTAPDLAPVIVPVPGTFKPQPGGTGPHTTRIPALTDTGELRALTAQTDAWLEGMRQKGLIA